MPATTVKPISNEAEIKSRFLHRYTVWKALFLWHADVLSDVQAVKELGVIDVNEANWVRDVAVQFGQRERVASMF